MSTEKDFGRTDKKGNKEFIVEIIGGPKKYYKKVRRRRNPFFIEPPRMSPSIHEAWFTDLLRELRKQRLTHGFTQQLLAHELHSNQSVISKFELGLTNPTMEFLIRYAQAVDKKISVTIR